MDATVELDASVEFSIVELSVLGRVDDSPVDVSLVELSLAVVLSLESPTVLCLVAPVCPVAPVWLLVPVSPVAPV